MPTIDRTRLKVVEDAANFVALVQDNMEILAEYLGRVVPTYQSGIPTTIVGPPTAGTWVANDFWRDGALGEWRCTVGGTPGTWVQVKDAYVTANPTTTVTGYLITRTDLGGERYYWDGAGWEKVNATATDLETEVASQVAELPWKAAVRVATTADITLSGEQTIDGVAVVTGDPVLVKDQSNGEENGIWTCDSSSWTRRADADSTAELVTGSAVYVKEGTVNAGRIYLLETTGAIVVGTTVQVWSQFQAAFPTLTVGDMPAEVLEIGLQLIIDGGGSALTTGLKGFLEVPADMTIQSVTLLADQTGDVVIDVWADTYANYPPTVADTITAAAKPTISSGVKSTDSTLTGWTTSLAKGDVLAFNVDSVATITRVTVSIKGVKV